MEVQCQHTMKELFAQLGLPDNSMAIRAFVNQHSPLDPSIRLADADFWTPSQAAFLREVWRQDGEWVLVVDTLNALLREHPQIEELEQL